ncbi:Pr6Pr family membrane protein [Agromyces sp. S2-1-8]|uniref:Pr6Pr family membrane protein n=1 Tax=unclassified Agromyces TaxID=2639701 RepID=UPI001E34B3D3|nr:Pr6Pr family membrane protein [Agromyces sp. S2-1-8]MCD5348296.1 Pr6Pr family membrane protein [Agromyces sp. S2-1-8]
MRRVFGVLRVLAAALIITAIVGQFVKSLSMVEDPGSFVVNFFSFFTILSNALAAVVLLAAAWFAFRSETDSPGFTVVRVCATAYMTTTLVVYNTLLRDISLDQATTVPWSNEILHVWAPLYLLADWVLAPGRRPVPWRRLWTVALFPLAWAAYTMLRGAIVGWYPYPFLDPAVKPGVGYDGVLVYVVAIAAFILLVGAGVIAISRTAWPYRGGAAEASPVVAPEAASDADRVDAR